MIPQQNEAIQELLADIEEQLTSEKLFDIISEIVKEAEKDASEYKAEHDNKEPTPLARLCWITRQAFIMGFSRGIDSYSKIKGRI